MWWRKGAILALALLLAGCGFEPLYAARQETPGRLAVDVAPIPNRDGQILRDALRRAFDYRRAAEYAMHVTLAESIETAAIDPRGDVTRRRMTIAANWRLARLDAPAGSAPVAGTVRVFEAFNVLASDFANVSAERAARARASDRLAHQIAQAATARVRAAGKS